MNPEITLHSYGSDIRGAFLAPLSQRIYDWSQLPEAAEIASPIIPEIAKKHADAIGYEPEPFLWGRTTQFLQSVSEQSSMPPVNFSAFVEQVVTAQASSGTIPLVLEGIACLNYPPNGDQKELGLQPLLPVEETGDSRWPKFQAEVEDFLRACNEIGIRSLFLFGVHDLLNFTPGESYFGSEDVLEKAISQNVTTMSRGILQLNNKFRRADLANPDMRPETAVFTHSEVLSNTGVLRDDFQEAIAFFEQNPLIVNELRNWLLSEHPDDVSDVEKQNKDDHLARLTKIVSLYATDKLSAAKLAKKLFPGENIAHVVQVSLQPSKTSEWAMELAAVHARSNDADVIQLSPFNNAGSWYGTHRHPAVFSAYNIYRSISRRGTSGTIRYLLQHPDELTIPDEKNPPSDLSSRTNQLAEWVCGKRSTAQAVRSFLEKNRA